MTKRLTLLTHAALLLGAVTASASAAPAPPDGTMTPLVPRTTLISLPDSLTPVLINHIGRHGARFLSSEKKVAGIERFLGTNSDNLSPAGHAMSSLIKEVRAENSGRWGALDQLGAMQQQAIALTMSRNFRTLLSEGDVKAISTYVPRVVMSMYQFCHELARRCPRLDITAAEGPRFNPLLRFFDTDSAYAAYLDHGPWRDTLAAYGRTHLPQGPAARLLASTRGIEPSQLRKISADMYAVVSWLPADSLPQHAGRWFTPEEYDACARYADLAHALARIGNPLSSLPDSAAMPLLRSFIAEADTALASHGKTVALLRFAHAETVMPLFSLMRLPGCHLPPGTPMDADMITSLWNDAAVSPLAANLQAIYSRSASGETYVTLVLNGHTVAPWPGAPETVRWSELRAFWLGD